MTEIHIIGCGGVGSWIVHFIRRAFPNPREVRLVLWDGDVVEEKNLPHSNFQKRDVGRQKSKVLASRYQGIARGNWNGEGLRGEVIICAVDDLSTRKRIIEQFADSRKVIDVRAEGKSWQVFLGSSKLIGTFVNGNNPAERRGCQDGNIIPDFGNVVAAAYVAQVVKSVLTRQPLPRSEWWGEVLGDAGKIEVQGNRDISPATCSVCGTKISRGTVDRDGAVYCPSCSPSNSLPVGEVGMLGDRPVLVLEDKFKVWKEIVKRLRNLDGWQFFLTDIRRIELWTTVLSAPVLTPIGVRYLGPVPFRVIIRYVDGSLVFDFATDIQRGLHPHLNGPSICWGEGERLLVRYCPADEQKVLEALESNLGVFKKLLSDGMSEGYTNPIDCLFACYTVSKPYSSVKEFQKLLKDDPIYRYRQSGGEVPYCNDEKLRLLQKLTGQLKETEVQIPRIDWRQAVRYYEEHPLTLQPQQQLEQRMQIVEARQTQEGNGRWWEQYFIPGINSPFIRVIYAPPLRELSPPENISVIVRNEEGPFYPPAGWYRVTFGDVIVGAISSDFTQVIVRGRLWVPYLQVIAGEMANQGGGGR